MKQLLVKLSDDEFRALDEYCKKTGRTKSAVIRYHIAKLNDKPSADFRNRKIKRISPGKGKLVSELILEMRG